MTIRIRTSMITGTITRTHMPIRMIMGTTMPIATTRIRMIMTTTIIMATLILIPIRMSRHARPSGRGTTI
jgi:hypothetical protein